MTPEDQAAFEAAFLRTFTFPEISDQLTFKLGFQAGLAHRNAQASAVNQQMLEALKKLYCVVIEKNREGADWGNQFDALMVALSLSESAITEAKSKDKP